MTLEEWAKSQAEWLIGPRWHQRHPTRRPVPAVDPQPAPGLLAAVAAAGEGLAHLDLHGPHDMPHTFAIWLEDAGIPLAGD
jgi:hypothetical protein